MASLFQRLRLRPTTEQVTETAKNLHVTSLQEAAMVLGQASAQQLLEAANDQHAPADDALRCVLAGVALHASYMARMEQASGDRTPLSIDNAVAYEKAASHLLADIE